VFGSRPSSRSSAKSSGGVLSSEPSQNGQPSGPLGSDRRVTKLSGRAARPAARIVLSPLS